MADWYVMLVSQLNRYIFVTFFMFFRLIFKLTDSNIWLSVNIMASVACIARVPISLLLKLCESLSYHFFPDFFLSYRLTWEMVFYCWHTLLDTVMIFVSHPNKMPYKNSNNRWLKSCSINFAFILYLMFFLIICGYVFLSSSVDFLYMMKAAPDNRFMTQQINKKLLWFIWLREE